MSSSKGRAKREFQLAILEKVACGYNSNNEHPHTLQSNSHNDYLAEILQTSRIDNGKLDIRKGDVDFVLNVKGVILDKAIQTMLHGSHTQHRGLCWNLHKIYCASALRQCCLMLTIIVVVSLVVFEPWVVNKVEVRIAADYPKTPDM